MGGRVHLQNIPSIINQFPQYLRRPYSVPSTGHYYSVWLGALKTERPSLNCAGETEPSCWRKPLSGVWRELDARKFPLSLPPTTQRSTSSLRPTLLPARISRFVLFCSLHQATLNSNPSRRHKLTFYYVYLLGSPKADMQMWGSHSQWGHTQMNWK